MDPTTRMAPPGNGSPMLWAAFRPCKPKECRGKGGSMGAMNDRPCAIDLVREPPLAWIVLNHPEKLNAWSWESARQITAHAERLRFDDEIRAVIVRAEGRAFCAGVDLGMPEDRIT